MSDTRTVADAEHTPRRIVVVPDPGNDCDECGTEYSVSWMVGWEQTGGGVVGLATIMTDDREEANARRFAACWNAAHDAGLSTEALESGAVVGLREAAEKGLSFINHALEFFGWSAFPNLQAEVERARDFIAAALAKGGAS